MFKRSALSSAIILAGSVWGSSALANTDSDAPFSSAADINKVSEWMGKEVQDNEGNDVGEISDFALNLEDGSIAYAVVELGGMFSSEAIAVPLTALSASAESEDELTLQVSQSEWKSAETFPDSDWPLQASLGADTGTTATGMHTDANSDARETADAGRYQSEDQYGQSQDQSGQAENQYSQAENQYGETDNQYGQTENQVGQAEDQYSQSSGAVSGIDQGVEFDNLDTDGDGYLSTQELQAAKGTSATDGTDQDQDGRISRSEFAAFEPSEQESGMQNESSTDDRYGESDADQSYDSQDTDDAEIDE